MYSIPLRIGMVGVTKSGESNAVFWSIFLTEVAI